jgi:hypothetical protein
MKMTRDNEILIKQMMEACDKDPALRHRLLKDPKQFAKDKYKVDLSDQEEEQLLKVGQLMQLVNDFTAGRVGGPGPIFYPADVWWKRAIRNHVTSYSPLYNKLFYQIPLYSWRWTLYPPDVLRGADPGAIVSGGLRTRSE